MSEEKTSVRISKKNRERLYAIGVKGETFDKVLNRLFSMINDLKKSLASASEKIQKSRELGRISLAHQGASELEHAVHQFLKAVESRSE